LQKGWYAADTSLSQEDYFSMWESESYQKTAENMLVVMLTAYTSKKQLEYEDEVLRAIVDENGGRYLPDEFQEGVAQVVLPDLTIRPNVIFRGFRIAGAFFDIKGVVDSIDHSALGHKTTLPLLKRFMKDKTPPFMDDEGGHHYICSSDFAHMGWVEMPYLFEPDVDFKNARVGVRLPVMGLFHDVWHRTHTAFLLNVAADIMGPFMGGFHKIIRKVKTSFDPNNVANPPFPQFVYGRFSKDLLKYALKSYQDKKEIREREVKENV
jgi:hypothetical protein